MNIKQLLLIMAVMVVSVNSMEAQKARKVKVTPQEETEIAWATDTSDANY